MMATKFSNGCDKCGRVTNSTQSKWAAWTMRGNGHTGCLAGPAQDMPTLLSVSKVRTDW